MTRANDPVFPGPTVVGGALGLSTREYFAALAMRGLLTQVIKGESTYVSAECIAANAVRMADALIAALNGANHAAK